MLSTLFPQIQGATLSCSTSQKKSVGGEGGSVDSGWGDTVHLRIALWEGKRMGEALGTCRDLLALVAEELK